MSVSFINRAFRVNAMKMMWYICDTKWTEQSRPNERTCTAVSPIHTHTIHACMHTNDLWNVSLFRRARMSVSMCEAHCAIEKRKKAITGSCYHILFDSFTPIRLFKRYDRDGAYVNNMLLLSFGCCFYGQINVMHLSYTHTHT